MYKYKFDGETGGLLLTETEEKNILGFNRRRQYEKSELDLSTLKRTAIKMIMDA